MSSFIYTPKGYVNLNRIEIAEHTKGADHKIIIDGEVIDEKGADFGKTIISMIPVQGAWECLVPCSVDDGPDIVDSYPIIAWGLTALGYAVPLTPLATGGPEGEYALRNKGDARVFDQIGQEFKDADDWMANRAEQGKKLQTVK